MSKLKLSEKELLAKIKQARRMARRKHCFDLEDDFAQAVALSFCMGRKSNLTQIWIDLMRKEWGNTDLDKGRAMNEARQKSTSNLSKLAVQSEQEELAELTLLLDRLPDNLRWMAEMLSQGYMKIDVAERSGITVQGFNHYIRAIRKKLNKRGER